MFSSFSIPILVGGLIFYRRQHINRFLNGNFFESDNKYRTPFYHEKLENCSECNRLSKTSICFSCWIKIGGYPENI